MKVRLKDKRAGTINSWGLTITPDNQLTIFRDGEGYTYRTLALLAEEYELSYSSAWLVAGWKENGIKSKLTNLIIAPEDYTEGERKFFTWEEAMEINVPGWRLPTRSEWVLIIEEFGCGKDGKMSPEKLYPGLKLALNGRIDCDKILWGVGTSGYWWSSTRRDEYAVYGLYAGGSTPFVDYRDKDYGCSVRLVKEIDQ